MARQVLVGVVADRVALERIRLQHLDRAIDLFHPAGIAGREDRVRERPPAAGDRVDRRARPLLHVVGQEPVGRYLGGRAADAGDLGVAVEIDLLQEVRELQLLDRLRLVDQRRIPAGLAHRFAAAQETFEPGVVTQEVRVHVHDELPRQAARALAGHLRRACFGLADREHRAVDVVHRDERGGHAAGGLEEAAPGQPLVARQFGAELLDPPFECPLAGRLRGRREFIAGHRLHRNRRREQHRIGRYRSGRLARGSGRHGVSSPGECDRQARPAAPPFPPAGPDGAGRRPVSGRQP